MDSSSENQTLESMLVSARAAAPPQQETRKPRPADEQALKCPRCDSANTKFCYYNNYSLSQPRYFCKSCRRYWTKGGTLRNVPVGGGCRRNNRRSNPNNNSSSSPSPSSAKNIRIQEYQSMMLPTSGNPNPLIPLPSSTNNNTLSSPYDHYPSHDVSLAIAKLHHKRISSLGYEDNSELRTVTWANNNIPSISSDVLGIMNSDIGRVNTSLGLFDGGFLHHHHHNQQAPGDNFYGSLIMGAVENNGGGFGLECGHHECGGGGGGNKMTMASTSAMKQEQNRGGLWGFPWEINGADGDDVGSNSQSWNGIGSGNNWHGLLNSPLI